jgi:hypothetical protein
MNLANYTNFDIKILDKKGFHIWVEDIWVCSMEKAVVLALDLEPGKAIAWAKHERVEGIDHWISTEGQIIDSIL